MRFTLEITLGNDAMLAYSDITDVLQTTVMRIKAGASLMNAEPTNTDGGKIRDSNGNTVGKWEVRD